MSIQTLAQAEELKSLLIKALETWEQHIEIKEHLIWALCLRLLNRDEHLFCSVRFENQKIIAFLIAQKQWNWLSDKPIVQELSLFVLPEYRGRGEAREMIQELMAWAQKENATAIYTLSPPELSPMAEHYGFQLLGHFYQKKL